MLVCRTRLTRGVPCEASASYGLTLYGRKNNSKKVNDHLVRLGSNDGARFPDCDSCPLF